MNATSGQYVTPPRKCLKMSSGECVVVHFSLNEMIFCALIGESFQKRAASRARLPRATRGGKVGRYRVRRLRE
jgi:hypothetical protein